MIDGTYTGKYVGKDGICGLIKGHIYDFKLGNNGRTYELYAYNDKTLNQVNNIFINYASETSVKQNWNLGELKDENKK